MKKYIKTDKEQWRWIKGFKKLYKVSDKGRIKSISRIYECWNHNANKVCLREHKGRILVNSLSNKIHYATVVLRKKSKSHSKSVHCLVYQAFKGKLIKGLDVMHLDNDKENNYVSNLEQGSKSCNQSFRVENGTHGIKLVESEVTLIIELLNKGVSGVSLASMFNVEACTISKIKRNEIWTYLER